jgi:glycosyltransferase involved in cell wall biosynthesis
MLREALTSVVSQDYGGRIEVIVVFDNSDVDESLPCEYRSEDVRIINNTRSPGLAGARNSGVLAATGSIVAFCDDDDKWLSGKLGCQVDALVANPHAEFSTTAMTVNFNGRMTPRFAHAESVRYEDLLRSRMAMLHSSSFLMWRDALLNDIGLVDERLPRSMAEDWELLLRAAKRQPIVHVDRPLVDVRWGATSYFADQWDIRKRAQLFLMDRYPDKLMDPIAAGLSYGKLAFGEAAQGHRRSAFRWAWKAFRANWREPRLYLASVVALGIVPAPFILHQLNQRGRGI